MTQETASYIFNLFHSGKEPIIIGGAPPPDSNKNQGKCMFCNLKTDQLGPKHLLNKAATCVKKKTAIVGSVRGTGKINVPKDIAGNSLQKKGHGTEPSKHNLTQVIITSTQQKK
ncbi:hypothetical protein PISMIDRAFT_19567 [Pisolithus microcarpus 441]|uniref:Uncharacterized protein n=1 Tax=Pisolithus microcarpus 441 TaxID=765257 RepID=A0A0C9XGD6_9AGAM|nr:hypothetical protein PISMIDRAFT_19567 [Pisolithus microcarpus 441]